MKTLLKALVFVVAVCCLSWVAVLFVWQRRGYSPDGMDLLLYLVLLPVVVALVVLGLRALFKRVGAWRVAAMASAQAAAVPAQAATQAEQPTPSTAVVHLWHASCLTPAGEEPAQVLDAAKEGKPLPRPDAELLGATGLPVMCARLPAETLELETTADEVHALLKTLAQQDEGEVPQTVPTHVLRALAALRPVLQSQRDFLLGQTQWAVDPVVASGRIDGALAQSATLPSLKVLLGWPAHWTRQDQALGRAFAQRCLLQEGEQLTQRMALSFHALAGGGEALWLRADQMSHAATEPGALLVLACDSALSVERVDALAAEGRLHEADACPQGLMPGEAASALLLFSVPAASQGGGSRRGVADVPADAVRVHRAALARREKPVESRGRIAHVELQAAAIQALAGAAVQPEQVGFLVSDADQHTGRAAELFGFMGQALEPLDAAEDVTLLGRVTGHIGPASALLAVAVAAQAAKDLEKPVLALGMADAQARMALVLQPQAKDAVVGQG